MVHDTLQARPGDGSTPWSVRSMANPSGLSKSTVHPLSVWHGRANGRGILRCVWQSRGTVSLDRTVRKRYSFRRRLPDLSASGIGASTRLSTVSGSPIPAALDGSTVTQYVRHGAFDWLAGVPGKVVRFAAKEVKVHPG